MKKKDVVLLAGILVFAFLGYIGVYVISYQDAAKVQISVDGEIYGIYSLKEEQEIQINETNVLLIKDGKADMIHADCPDQICVDQKEISKTGESIVCLPNKVIVQVEGAESSELDAVTN